MSIKDALLNEVWQALVTDAHNRLLEEGFLPEAGKEKNGLEKTHQQIEKYSNKLLKTKGKHIC